VNVFIEPKKIILFIAVLVFVFAAGFFTRGLVDRKRISGIVKSYKNIQNELQNADEAHHRLEENIVGARSGIASGIELSGTIGIGLDGIERVTVENKYLLERAERILLEAGAREQSP